MRFSAARTRTARIAAFVATLVLVLQSALAVAAPPIQRDIFGNVICAPGSTETPAGDHGAKHLPECCVLSCGAALQTAGDVPAAVQWQAGAKEFGAAIPLPPAEPFSPHDRRTPGNPRAPPHAA